MFKPVVVILDCYLQAKMKCVGSYYPGRRCVFNVVSRWISVHAGMMKNVMGTLFYILAAMRPGWYGSEQAFICSHSLHLVIYSTERGTLSNL